MPIVSWSNAYSVEVEEIDNQHKKLFDLINELHDAMRNRNTKDVLGNIISELINYTQSHFLTEEKYFLQFGYAAKDSHIKTHNDFVKKVKAFQNDFDKGKLMLSMEIISFLKDWIVNHINGDDKKYVTFFKENGLN